MNRSSLLLWFLTCSFCASAALADEIPKEPTLPETPTPTQDAAAKLVQEKLLAPIAAAGGKRKKFSRAAPPPIARRVRVTDAEALTDARGKHFVRFVIDTRHFWDEEGLWEASSLLGCAYVEEQLVFVKQGDEFVKVKRKAGDYGPAQAGACVGATSATDTLASAR